jgi:hypothetical protein
VVSTGGGAASVHHFVIVRRDLPLGIIGANIVHAAGESSPGNLSSGTHAVVLVVPDESALKAVAARLELARVPCKRIIEDDPPYMGQLMAIGCVPGRKEVVGRYLSSLPLLK